jgi:hypothetical protein
MNEEVADEVSAVALSKCTEKDVLLGRGNRNNTWPGNIHFRNVAMKYREEYSKVNRCQKVVIALKVIEEITARGGRFVQVDQDAYNSSSSNGMYCFEVDQARSVEKTCQVLRKKISSKYKPFKGNGEVSNEIKKVSRRKVVLTTVMFHLLAATMSLLVAAIENPSALNSCSVQTKC